MGLYDRDYVRRTPRRGLGSFGVFSVNTWLIIANVAVFALGAILEARKVNVPVFTGMATPWREVKDLPPTISVSKDLLTDRAHPGLAFRPVIDPRTGEQVNLGVYRMENPLDAYGHFSTARILGAQREDRQWHLNLEVWRFVTFQFLHANLTHIAFNMIGLFMFGPIVEQLLGGKRYLAFYLVCGIFGGISYMLLNALGTGLASVGFTRIPGLLIEDPTRQLVGASAGVLGVIVACAYIAPDMRVQLIFPPIPLRLKTMAYAYVAIAVINLFLGGTNAGGDAAHLGGAVAGYFFIRNSHLLRDFFDVLRDSRLPGTRKPGLRLADADLGPGSSADDRFEAEVNRILDKVRRQGGDSLSESEKLTLQRATQRKRAAGD